jgi:hypothetical protein
MEVAACYLRVRLRLIWDTLIDIADKRNESGGPDTKSAKLPWVRQGNT